MMQVPALPPTMEMWVASEKARDTAERYSTDWLTDNGLLMEADKCFHNLEVRQMISESAPAWPDAVRLELEKRGLMTPELLARFVALKLEIE